MNRNNQEMAHLCHIAHIEIGPDGRQFPDCCINLTPEFVQESGMRRRHCVELGTPAFAPDREQARQQLVDAVIQHLSGPARLNELADYLKRNNVHCRPTPPLPETAHSPRTKGPALLKNKAPDQNFGQGDE